MAESMCKSPENQYGPANRIKGFAGPVFMQIYFVLRLVRLMIYSVKSISMTPVGSEIQALCVKPATI